MTKNRNLFYVRIGKKTINSIWSWIIYDYFTDGNVLGDQSFLGPRKDFKTRAYEGFFFLLLLLSFLRFFFWLKKRASKILEV